MTPKFTEHIPEMSEIRLLDWHHPAYRLLADIRYAGMRWVVEGGELYVEGKTENLTDDHRERIDQHRAKLVATLESLPCACVAPYACGVVGPCSASGCAQAATARQSGEEAA